MNISVEEMETQLKTFGFIFEQMCIRDLKIYTADFNSRISYKRVRPNPPAPEFRGCLRRAWRFRSSGGRYILVVSLAANVSLAATGSR